MASKASGRIVSNAAAKWLAPWYALNSGSTPSASSSTGSWNVAQNAWNSMTTQQQQAWSAKNPGINPMTAPVVNQLNTQTWKRWAADWSWYVSASIQPQSQMPDISPQQAPTMQEAAVTPSQTTPATTEDTSYTWSSVYDYLKSQGQDASFWARKKLAQQYGINWYTGSAQQNTQLLGSMRAGQTPAPSAQWWGMAPINPQGMIGEQVFKEQAWKLWEEYMAQRNATITTNLKGVAKQAVMQWLINNDWDLENLVVDYLNNAGKWVDVTDPDWQNTVTKLAESIKLTPDYMMAIWTKFDVDNFTWMDVDGLFRSIDNWILLPGSDVWNALQAWGMAAKLSEAKSKYDLQTSQHINNYIMDYQNTDPNSSLSSQAGGDMWFPWLIKQLFGIDPASTSTTTTSTNPYDDPEIKSMIDAQKTLYDEVAQKKQTIAYLKEDLQAQILAGWWVSTEWYLEALAAERGKPLTRQYQALVDQYNGITGKIESMLKYKEYEQTAQTNKFNQQLSMLEFWLKYKTAMTPEAAKTTTTGSGKTSQTRQWNPETSRYDILVWGAWYGWGWSGWGGWGWGSGASSIATTIKNKIDFLRYWAVNDTAKFRTSMALWKWDYAEAADFVRNNLALVSFRDAKAAGVSFWQMTNPEWEMLKKSSLSLNSLMSVYGSQGIISELNRIQGAPANYIWDKNYNPNLSIKPGSTTPSAPVNTTVNSIIQKRWGTVPTTTTTTTTTTSVKPSTLKILRNTLSSLW